MNTKLMLKEVEKDTSEKQLTEMADAHCHLDLLDPNAIKESVLFGVRSMITNGVDLKSNYKSLELADNRNVYPMLGIDPQHSDISEAELEFNMQVIRQSHSRIVGIGEIGLDYGAVKEKVSVEKQKWVFEHMLDLAKQLKLPVSIHSRDALEDVMHILEKKDIEFVHMHFFEGNVQQAKELERKGYMISVPPVQSGKRSKVIKEIAIDNIMAESDAPAVGATPKDVYKSIGMISEIKKLEFKKTADLLTANTKRFFRIHTKGAFMRF
ncbi:MAG: TatD family hydrolase [Candidatus Micrarchaeaceae archaeon]|jgi:TatD DNase family protein